MRFFLAILVGKFISYLTKTLRFGGGSAAPGLYALKVDPNLVEKLIQKIPKNIVVTGTNGKTTTARMISNFATESELKVIRNHTGSNLERGIASTLISHTSSHLTRLDYDLGVWELDEAAFNTVAPKLNPDIIVFLNVSRDQLDRYGELDKVVNMWCETLVHLDPKTIVLINADDPSLGKLEKHFKGTVIKFGKKNIKNIRTKGLAGSFFDLEVNNIRLAIDLPLPGLYHIYDFLAAFYTGDKLNFSDKDMISSLKNFTPAFGRVEKFELQPLRLHRKNNGYIFLIKNPAGATQVFETLAPSLKPQDRLLIALNDNLADGTDVSWIWDAEWERLLVTGSRYQVVCSGIRAHDLALRLKYAGFSSKGQLASSWNSKQITIEPDLEKAFQDAQRGLKGTLYVLPTYTAMLGLQRILTKAGVKESYWKEKGT